MVTAAMRSLCTTFPTGTFIVRRVAATNRVNAADMGTAHDDDSETLPIPLDGKTVERLLRLARACGDDPATIAASLLRDILADDEAVNILERPGVCGCPSSAKH